MKYSRGSAGSTGHGCSQVQTSLKPAFVQPLRGLGGRREVPRAGPVPERGMVDRVDRGLDVGDVAGAAALRREPAAGLQRRVQAGEQPLMVGDPVERRRREDRVHRLVELELDQVRGERRDAALAGLGHHRLAAVDGDHRPIGNALDDECRDPAGAAAGVEDPLVALEIEAVDDIARHRGQGVRHPVVRGGFPFTRRHTFVRYHVRTTIAVVTTRHAGKVVTTRSNVRLLAS